MQDREDYQRGLEAARADAKEGWARCWLPASQLAEEAVYSSFGLSAEQRGYAAGLDEAYPGGLAEISEFLDGIISPGTLLVMRIGGWEPEAEADAADTELSGAAAAAEGEAENERRCCGKQWGNGFQLLGTGERLFKIKAKGAFLARFVYVNTHTITLK